MKKILTTVGILALVIFGIYEGLLLADYRVYNGQMIKLDGDFAKNHLPKVNVLIDYFGEEICIYDVMIPTLTTEASERLVDNLFVGEFTENDLERKINHIAVKQAVAKINETAEEASMEIKDCVLGEGVNITVSKGAVLDANKVVTSLESDLFLAESMLDLTKYEELLEQAESIQNRYDSIMEAGVYYSVGKSILLHELLEDETLFEFDKKTLIWECVNKELLTQVIREKLEDFVYVYNTVGKEAEIQTPMHQTLKVTGGTYGNTVDLDAETEYAVNELLKGIKSERVKPFYNEEEVTMNFATSLIVDIERQHVYHYYNGKLCCDSDVVTGTKDKTDTPIGIFYICDKIPGKYLNGPTWHVWVDNWMRITDDGVGFHDATWRKKFGGEIYLSDGSHGCINLPLDYADNLYMEVDKFTPVIIY